MGGRWPGAIRNGEFCLGGAGGGCQRVEWDWTAASRATWEVTPGWYLIPGLGRGEAPVASPGVPQGERSGEEKTRAPGGRAERPREEGRFWGLVTMKGMVRLPAGQERVGGSRGR